MVVLPENLEDGDLDAGDVDVLVAEDDDATRDLVRRTLEGQGWRVACAGDGQDVLDLLPRVRPGLLLLDLLMPRLDGFEVLARLAVDPDWRDLPVVVLTSRELAPDETARLRSRVEGLLAKGDGTRADILKAVAAALARRGRETVAAATAEGA